jgi:FkbM family methyltransferase
VARWLRGYTRRGRALNQRFERLRQFYQQFITRDALCFDIGANYGDRTSTFLELGAIVVAVEPQDDCMEFLRLKYGRNPRVKLIHQGLADHPGERTLAINPQNPLVASMSPDWIAGIRQRPRFSQTEWSTVRTVPVTTLDELIQRYGLPAFCKIDVEGFEYQVLQGLSQPIPSVSLEYTPELIEMACACVDYLEKLGVYQFNYSVEESLEMTLPAWVDGTTLKSALRKRASIHISGDIYARLTQLRKDTPMNTRMTSRVA